MYENKLLKLLKTFTKTEIRKFRDFIKSPYYNKNKKVIAYTECVLRFHPEYSSDELQEENIFAKIYKNEIFDYHKIKNIVSDVYSLCFEFLKLQRGFFTDFGPELNLLTQLLDRNQLELFSKIYKKEKNKVYASAGENQMVLYNKYLLSVVEHIYYTQTSHRLISGINNTVSGMQKLHDYFFEYSLLTLLRQYNAMIHNNIENSYKYNMKLFDGILKYLKETENFSSTTTLIYKYITLLTVHLDEKYYSELKDMYINNLNKIDAADADTAYFYLQDYCATKYNKYAEVKYQNERYQLCKFTFDNNKEFLTGFHYYNYLAYIRIFTAVGDIKTTEKFIMKWRYHIPEEQKSNCINYAEALIQYTRKNFEKALYSIAKVVPSSAIEKLQVKVLCLKMLTEVGNLDQARTHAESFKHFLLNNSEISNEYKILLKNFLNNYIKLVNIKELNNRKDRKSEAKILLKKAEKLNGNYFGVKIWLIEQIQKESN